MNDVFDDFDIIEFPNQEQVFCQCGDKVSFGCEDQCRVCFYSAKFKAKNILTHLSDANVPPKSARRASKLALRFKENKKAYPGSLIPETFSHSLFLPGKAGIGKTSFALLTMMYHMEQFNCVKGRFQKGKTFLFETTQDMIQILRHAIRGSVEDEIATIDKYKNVDFLILDDFGVEKSTDWAFSVLYLIISHRYEEDKQTIFTSNFDLDQLAEKNNDERLTRRISDWCKIIHLTR